MISRMRLFTLFFCLAAATTSQALIIFGGSITNINERFVSGFPGAPVANSSGSFLGTGLDLSGVGWLTASTQFSLTLISPQHFVIAAHTAPSAGASVSFLNQNGVVMNYTVSSVTTITHTAGVNTDIAIGRLSAPIAGADLITSYPLLQLSTYGQYLGLSLLVYGQNGRIGTNTLDAFHLNADMLPFGSGNGVADSTLFSTDHDSVAGESQGESGDSGSPTFFVSGGALALLGVHSGINTDASPDLTFDSFLPSYYGQINTLLQVDGFTLQAIPEPAAGAAVLALPGALWVFWRRRRKDSLAG